MFSVSRFISVASAWKNRNSPLFVVGSTGQCGILRVDTVKFYQPGASPGIAIVAMGRDFESDFPSFEVKCCFVRRN